MGMTADAARSGAMPGLEVMRPSRPAPVARPRVWSSGGSLLSSAAGFVANLGAPREKRHQEQRAETPPAALAAPASAQVSSIVAIAGGAAAAKGVLRAAEIVVRNPLVLGKRSATMAAVIICLWEQDLWCPRCATEKLSSKALASAGEATMGSARKSPGESLAASR